MRNKAYGLLLAGLLLFCSLQMELAAAPVSQPPERQWINSSLRRCLAQHESPESLQAGLLQELRRQAIERAAGVWVESQTWLLNHSLQQDRVQIFSRAHILRETGLESRWQTSSSEGLPCLSLSGRFLVEAYTTPPADAPQIQLTISQPELISGQTAWLSFQVSQTSFIALYNVSQSGIISRLLPNALQPEPFQALAGQSYRFPDEHLRKNGLQLKPRLLPGQRSSQEHVLLIATREPLPGIDSDVPEALFALPDSSEKMFYTHLQQRLMQLPPGAWNEAWLSYRILAGPADPE